MEEENVMMNIERIEGKRDIENLRQLIAKYSHRFDWEKTYSEKASGLANQDSFPFFHKPVCPPVLRD
jgi:hypothetical protein